MIELTFSTWVSTSTRLSIGNLRFDISLYTLKCHASTQCFSLQSITSNCYKQRIPRISTSVTDKSYLSGTFLVPTLSRNMVKANFVLYRVVSCSSVSTRPTVYVGVGLHCATGLNTYYSGRL